MHGGEPGPLAVVGEERAHLVRYIKERVRGQAKLLHAVHFHEFRARLAVRLLRAGDLRDAFADERLGDDELRLAAARRLGMLRSARLSRWS